MLQQVPANCSIHLLPDLVEKNIFALVVACGLNSLNMCPLVRDNEIEK